MNAILFKWIYITSSIILGGGGGSWLVFRTSEGCMYTGIVFLLSFSIALHEWSIILSSSQHGVRYIARTWEEKSVVSGSFGNAGNFIRAYFMSQNSVLFS